MVQERKVFNRFLKTVSFILQQTAFVNYFHEFVKIIKLRRETEKEAFKNASFSLKILVPTTRFELVTYRV